MRTGTLLKLAGVAAIAGGALRIADAFTTGVLDEHTLQLLYFATDFLFLLGLVGIYAPRADALGLGGMIGFTVTVLGFLIIRSSTLSFFGLDGYMFGATVVALGMAVMSTAILIRKAGSRCAAALWLLSLALGIVGAVSGMPFAGHAAGVVFGAGFVVAGVGLLGV
jgi:hypothetical protein